jgi:hypothetical protein
VALAVSPAPKDEIEYRIRYLRLPGLDEPFEERDLIDESARAKLDEPIEKEVAGILCARYACGDWRLPCTALSSAAM